MRYRSNFKKVGACLLIVALSSKLNSAQASRNGVEQRNNTFTVGLSFNNAGVPEICSGALISPTFIATAAHCVSELNGKLHTDFIFTAPGTTLDAAINPATQPKILKTYIPEDYYRLAVTELNDIAFIELDKPLVTKGYIRIATPVEVQSLRDSLLITGYGYGAVYETGETYSNYPRSYSLKWKTVSNFVDTTMNTLKSETSVACSGDSGGPITAKLESGEEILIAALHDAAAVVDRCGTRLTDDQFQMQVTLFNQFLPLIKDPLAKSLIPPAPTPVVVKKKTYKITCVKGKIKKYVIGTNPKCPSGYKQTAKVLISK